MTRIWQALPAFCHFWGVSPLDVMKWPQGLVEEFRLYQNRVTRKQKR